MKFTAYLLQNKDGKYFSKTLYKGHVQEVNLEDYLKTGSSFCLEDYQFYLDNMSKSERDSQEFKIVKFNQVCVHEVLE